MPTYAPLAQSVEQRTVNPCVVGSSPTGGAREIPGIRFEYRDFSNFRARFETGQFAALGHLG